jgi:Cu2+-containing amine oxidase
MQGVGSFLTNGAWGFAVAIHAGSPVAYKLMTAAGPVLLAKPSSSIAQRGGFATKHIWVTPHADDEMFPSGDYTIMSKGGEGITEWTKQVQALDLGPPHMVANY